MLFIKKQDIFGGGGGNTKQFSIITTDFTKRTGRAQGVYVVLEMKGLDNSKVSALPDALFL